MVLINSTRHTRRHLKVCSFTWQQIRRPIRSTCSPAGRFSRETGRSAHAARLMQRCGSDIYSTAMETVQSSTGGQGSLWRIDRWVRWCGRTTEGFEGMDTGRRRRRRRKEGCDLCRGWKNENVAAQCGMKSVLTQFVCHLGEEPLQSDLVPDRGYSDQLWCQCAEPILTANQLLSQCGGSLH